jgi:hypothetical protein
VLLRTARPWMALVCCAGSSRALTGSAVRLYACQLRDAKEPKCGARPSAAERRDGTRPGWRRQPGPRGAARTRHGRRCCFHECDTRRNVERRLRYRLGAVAQGSGRRCSSRLRAAVLDRGPTDQFRCRRSRIAALSQRRFLAEAAAEPCGHCAALRSRDAAPARDEALALGDRTARGGRHRAATRLIGVRMRRPTDAR